MRFLAIASWFGVSAALTSRIDPEVVRMMISTFTVASDIAMPPRMDKFVNKMLNNRLGNFALDKTVKLAGRHERFVTSALMRVMHSPRLVTQEILPPRLGAGNIRKRLRFGPINLPPAGVKTFSTKLTGEKGSRFGVDAVPPFCQDCVVYEGVTSLTYDNGTEALPTTGIFNHHTAIRNFGKMQPLFQCTSGPQEMLFPNEFLGAGEETGSSQFRSLDGKVNAGYYISPSDRFFVLSQLINYRPYPQSVYYTFEAEYSQGKQPSTMDTHMLFVNIGPCSDIGFHPSESSSKTADWHVPTDGYVLRIAGHLHAGGKNVTVALNGKTVCKSVATYGPTSMGGHHAGPAPEAVGELEETITSMSECTDSIPVKKGDVFSMTAYYEPSEHAL